MEPEPQEGIIDQLFHVLEQLFLPNWSDLIALLPWVLIALVIVFLLHTAWQWHRAGARNRPRIAARSSGVPPPGVHLPGPSRWPFVAPIGGALLLFAFALPARDATGQVVLPFDTLLFVAGLVVTLIGLVGWLREAMREWRATAEGAHSDAAQIGAAVEPGPAVEPEPAPVREAPPGVHMPGPSPWPFFAPIAMTIMLFGVVFSGVLMVGGLVLAVIAIIGWYLDAGHEYFSTEEVGHAVPKTRDPAQVWPRRLVPVFGAVIAISVLVTLAPVGLGYLNSLTPAKATPTPINVPERPEISASSAVSFDTKELIVPAGRPFELVFNNNDAGVRHNVEIAEGPDRNTVYLDGEVISGVASATSQVPALDPGDYYFLCKIHPNMNGTVMALPEGSPTGPSPAGPSPSP